MARLTIGYPGRDVERRIVEMRGYSDKVEAVVRQVATAEQVLAAQAAVDAIQVPSAVMDYAMELIHATRSTEALETGISTRGAVSLVAAARSHAALRGRAFCIPDDVKAVFVPAAAHRVLVRRGGSGGPAARDEAAAVLMEILGRTPVPGD
jgi:MoxR-like ATPase